MILDVSQRDFTTSFLSEHTELYITGTVFIFLSWFQIRICINTTGTKPEFLEKVALLFNLFLLIFFPECTCAHCRHVEPQRIVGVCRLVLSEPQRARAGECIHEVSVRVAEIML